MSQKETDVSSSYSESGGIARRSDTLKDESKYMSHVCVGRSSPPPNYDPEKGQTLGYNPMSCNLRDSRSSIIPGPPVIMSPLAMHTGLGVFGGRASI